jgi:sensor domain CHASE-containing protein
MQLRRRIGLFLGSVALLSGLLVGVALEATVMPSFLALEHEYALADFERVAQSLEREIRHLDTLAQDWGVWDEAHDFLAGENPDFIETNTYPEINLELDLCLLQIHDLSGKLVWQDRRAPPEYSGQELIELPADDWPSEHALLRGSGDRASLRGLLATSWGPVMVSAQPILRNNHSGDVLGTLLMLRAVDHSARAELAAETHVAFELIPIHNAEAHQGCLRPLESGTGSIEPELLVAADTVLTSAHLPDVLGRMAYHLEIQTPRSIVANGRRALAWAWGLLFLVGLGLILCLDHWLARCVVGPLRHFTQAALSVRTRGEAEKLLDMDRSDELGALARRFGAYLDDYQRFEQQLTSASHQAGMSEVATGVLHNVGNLLNGVTVSSALMRDRLAELPTKELRALAQRLAQDSAELQLTGNQAVAMRRLLELVAERQENSSRAALEECQHLSNRIGDVAGLVAAQQALARSGGFDEELDVDELLDVALRVALPPQHGLELRRGERRGQQLHGNRHKLLQILVNLIKNAAESYVGQPAGPAWIALDCQRSGAGLSISVSDGGQGIAPEQLTSIFQHGFTTKAKGHGFGLHSAAAAALEMGGELCVESAGRGLGARFVLRMPLGQGRGQPPAGEAAGRAA